MKELKDLKLKDKTKLNGLDEKSLKEELSISLKKIYELRMKKELNELKQTHLIKPLRKQVAIIKTIARQKGFNIA